MLITNFILSLYQEDILSLNYLNYLHYLNCLKYFQYFYLILFGQCALTAYLVGGFFRPVLEKLAEILTQGAPYLFGLDKQPMALLNAAVVAIEIAVVLAIWRKARAR